MTLGEVAVGVGLGAWGVGFYLFARWLGANDRRMRRMAESRWWLDRRVVRKVRCGEISKEEWFSRFAKQYRGTVKWIFTPFMLLWLAACVATIINGLTN